MGAKHATTKDIVRINEKLEQVIRKTDDGCAYIDRNVSDGTVAKELGLAQSSVAKVRKDLFGMLQAAHSGANSMAARLDALEAEILQLKQLNAKQAETIAAHTAMITEAARIANLGQEKHNALCTQISLNKVLDVRKLMYEMPIPLHPTGNGQQAAQSQIYRR